MSSKWDIRFLRLAREVSTWSKDPSTKTGAVIVEPLTRRVISMGYNGLTRRFPDLYEVLHDRESKLAFTIHAEENAVLHAPGELLGTTLYCYPWPPCSNCAKTLVQAGIARVVAIPPTEEQQERWGDSFTRMEILFREARVRFDTYDAKLLDPL